MPSAERKLQNEGNIQQKKSCDSHTYVHRGGGNNRFDDTLYAQVSYGASPLRIALYFSAADENKPLRSTYRGHKLNPLLCGLYVFGHTRYSVLRPVFFLSVADHHLHQVDEKQARKHHPSTQDDVEGTPLGRADLRGGVGGGVCRFNSGGL